jgi:hypothetical protein
LIEPGDHVKLVFRQSDGWGERMWVVVDKIGRLRIVGYLNSEPLDFPRLYPGRKIRFYRKHIIDILPPGAASPTPPSTPPRSPGGVAD